MMRVVLLNVMVKMYAEAASRQVACPLVTSVLVALTRAHFSLSLSDLIFITRRKFSDIRLVVLILVFYRSG